MRSSHKGNWQGEDLSRHWNYSRSVDRPFLVPHSLTEVVWLNVIEPSKAMLTGDQLHITKYLQFLNKQPCTWCFGILQDQVPWRPDLLWGLRASPMCSSIPGSRDNSWFGVEPGWGQTIALKGNQGGKKNPSCLSATSNHTSRSIQKPSLLFPNCAQSKMTQIPVIKRNHAHCGWLVSQ
jgi:hypothetical protein